MMEPSAVHSVAEFCSIVSLREIAKDIRYMPSVELAPPLFRPTFRESRFKARHFNGFVQVYTTKVHNFSF